MTEALSYAVEDVPDPNQGPPVTDTKPRETRLAQRESPHLIAYCVL